MMQLISHPSPNYDLRGDAPIEKLVLHYTGMQSGTAALERLCDAKAEVSAHYLVEEDGRIFQLVEEQYRAWHAGIAYWRGCRDINARSIGIEIVNPGHEFGYRDFPNAQMDAVIALCKEILTRHPAIPPRCVIGHSDVAFRRKQDPGERFDWPHLAKEGIGLWHDNPEDKPKFTALKRGDGGEAVRQMQEALVYYGYGLPVDGMFSDVCEQGVIAFQRHFRPEKLDGIWDAACAARLDKLLNLL